MFAGNNCRGGVSPPEPPNLYNSFYGDTTKPKEVFGFEKLYCILLRSGGETPPLQIVCCHSNCNMHTVRYNYWEKHQYLRKTLIFTCNNCVLPF